MLYNDNQTICVVKHPLSFLYLIYKLEKVKEYVFQFYGYKKFRVGLNKDLSLAEQPYGLIGSSKDLSGRISNFLASEENQAIFYPGSKMVFLYQPTYVLLGTYHESVLQKTLVGYHALKKDIPYASLTISTIGVVDVGEDLYETTLFFMTKGYGLLAETTIIAGRDIEDCCSPEIYHKLYKVKLDNINPIKPIKENEMVSGAFLSTRTVSISPEIIQPIQIGADYNQEKIEELLNFLYKKLLR